jgi:hypothetical protein
LGKSVDLRKLIDHQKEEAAEAELLYKASKGLLKRIRLRLNSQMAKSRYLRDNGSSEALSRIHQRFDVRNKSQQKARSHVKSKISIKKSPMLRLNDPNQLQSIFFFTFSCPFFTFLHPQKTNEEDKFY